MRWWSENRMTLWIKWRNKINFTILTFIWLFLLVDAPPFPHSKSKFLSKLTPTQSLCKPHEKEFQAISLFNSNSIILLYKFYDSLTLKSANIEFATIIEVVRVSFYDIYLTIVLKDISSFSRKCKKFWKTFSGCGKI